MTLDMDGGMLRDTLEMVPVALVLAIVLGFGARPSRPAPTPYLAAESITASSLRLQNATGSLLHGRASGGHRASPPPPFEPGRAELGQSENARDAERSAANSFLPRRSFDPSVPYFTAADIRSVSTPTIGSDRLIRPQPTSATCSTAYETPRTGAKPTEEGESSGGLQRPRVDINKAGASELTRIPGIGGTRARILIESRPPQGYRTWTEIDMLPGFGPGTLGMLQRHGALEVRAI